MYIICAVARVACPHKSISADKDFKDKIETKLSKLVDRISIKKIHQLIYSVLFPKLTSKVNTLLLSDLIILNLNPLKLSDLILYLVLHI